MGVSIGMLGPCVAERPSWVTIRNVANHASRFIIVLVLNVLHAFGGLDLDNREDSPCGSSGQTLARFRVVGDPPPVPDRVAWSIAPNIPYPLAERSVGVQH